MVWPTGSVLALDVVCGPVTHRTTFGPEPPGSLPRGFGRHALPGLPPGRDLPLPGGGCQTVNGHITLSKRQRFQMQDQRTRAVLPHIYCQKQGQRTRAVLPQAPRDLFFLRRPPYLGAVALENQVASRAVWLETRTTVALETLNLICQCASNASSDCLSSLVHILYQS